ncbi:MAG TPA: T9SS type A sorting domain-containing protein [Saprospiraceae bacterium]|nr:T9SS type A sorting domain-containing protein [Saprospiraceae bacterium]
MNNTSIIYILYTLCFAVSLVGQQIIKPDLLSTAFTHQVTNGYTFHGSLGELAVTDLNQNSRVSQGFYQGNVSEVSLSLNYNQTDIKIFPNPASQYIVISKDHNEFDLDLLSIEGKVVKHIGKVEDGQFIDIKDLEVGVYLLHVNTDNRKYLIKKIIKI